MAKKAKRHFAIPQSSLNLKNRVNRAMSEGRWQQALELGKELHRQETTPAHRELLLKIYLGRSRQLREQGQTRDAHTVLKNALEIAGDAVEWLGPLAEELAMIGQVGEALELARRLPGSEAQAKLQIRAVDAALTQGAAGRRSLPESLQLGFDLVVRAFGQVAAGQDDDARETLQGIGLQSPYLEWKLLLRGLTAYYRNDDARAVENWGRLSPNRVPVRLAAPFRFLIDPPFRLAQSPQAQQQFQKHADRLQGGGVISSLRGIQAALSRQKMSQAFQLVASVIPLLRKESPQHLSRLANYFYWSIVHSGDASDIPRYQRLFGAPADDPQFCRLEALALEFRGQEREAHQQWLRFEKSVADHPQAWPAGQAELVRALVWCHMGKQAEAAEDIDEETPRRRQSAPLLVPSVEECFRNSIKLAPDQREPYEALLQYYLDREQTNPAIEIAQQLLERFPDHFPTLQTLAELYLETGRSVEGLDLLRRAVRVNPLDRDLRSRIGMAHAVCAYHHAVAGEFDQSRAEFQSALANWEGLDRFVLLGKWATMEFKAANLPRAEELLAEARTEPVHALAVAFLMLLEANRYKLSRPLKTRFDKDFTQALQTTATAEMAISALKVAVFHRVAKVAAYRGQKTHEKKLLDYLGRVPFDNFTENQLQQVCAALMNLGEYIIARKYTERGIQRFQCNPHFPFLKAQTYILASPKRRSSSWEISQLLVKAEQRAQALPQDDIIRDLLEGIRLARESLNISANPLVMLGNIFGGMFDQFEDDL